MITHDTTRPTLIVADQIHTMDSAGSIVEAVLVDGSRILDAGSRRDVAQRAPGNVRCEEFPGATVVPGLIESHVHAVYTGLTDSWADCRSPQCASIGDVQAALRAKTLPNGWTRGWGYDDTLLAEGRHPTRDDLDAVSRDRPIIVQHISGHFLIANTAALAAAGVSEGSVAVDDPRFPRDKDGRLTGMAWEIDAVAQVLDALPVENQQDIEAALLASLATARSRGITTIHDLGVGLMAGPAELAAYRRLDAENRLPVHAVGFLRGDLALGALAAEPTMFEVDAAPGARFRLAGAKFWSDGSIQGLSAALRTPYHCDPTHCGDLLHSQQDLDAMVRSVHAAGGQVAIHANGDAAVAASISSIASAQASDGRRGRHRIEHCQVTQPADLPAMVDEGIGASFFANHIYYWGDRHRDRFLGLDRAEQMDPLSRADALGLRYGLHSDCPITPMDPLHTIRTASTRMTRDGSVLGAAERIDAERAVRAMTIDSAYLVHDEERVGALAPGLRADLVVLDAELRHLQDSDAAMPAVVQVMVDGNWSHA